MNAAGSQAADEHKRVTSRAYDRWSRVWNLARYTNSSIYNDTLACLDERHKRVLDVGCGTGLMSIRLANSGRQTIGVDISSAMLTRAQCLRHANLQFVHGDAENLPFEDASFDAVINLLSFHHYPNPMRAMSEFRRVSRPGGRLVLMIMDHDSSYIRFAQRVNGWTKNLVGTEWQKTRQEMLALVNGAKFTNIRIDPVCYWVKTFRVMAEAL